MNTMQSESESSSLDRNSMQNSALTGVKNLITNANNVSNPIIPVAAGIGGEGMNTYIIIYI